MQSPNDATERVVYWHRELPPLDGDVVDEHVVEAVSDRVVGSIERRGELWDRCRAQLMRHAQDRLEQEVRRLSGQYAHVIDERIEVKHDDGTGEAWLHGCFTYVLYVRRVG
jgi:hypothetical protein